MQKLSDGLTRLRGHLLPEDQQIIDEYIAVYQQLKTNPLSIADVRLANEYIKLRQIKKEIIDGAVGRTQSIDEVKRVLENDLKCFFPGREDELDRNIQAVISALTSSIPPLYKNPTHDSGKLKRDLDFVKRAIREHIPALRELDHHFADFQQLTDYTHSTCEQFTKADTAIRAALKACDAGVSLFLPCKLLLRVLKRKYQEVPEVKQISDELYPNEAHTLVILTCQFTPRYGLLLGEVTKEAQTAQLAIADVEHAHTPMTEADQAGFERIDLPRLCATFKEADNAIIKNKGVEGNTLGTAETAVEDFLIALENERKKLLADKQTNSEQYQAFTDHTDKKLAAISKIIKGVYDDIRDNKPLITIKRNIREICYSPEYLLPLKNTREKFSRDSSIWKKLIRFENKTGPIPRLLHDLSESKDDNDKDAALFALAIALHKERQKLVPELLKLTSESTQERRTSTLKRIEAIDIIAKTIDDNKHTQIHAIAERIKEIKNRAEYQSHLSQRRAGSRKEAPPTLWAQLEEFEKAHPSPLDRAPDSPPEKKAEPPKIPAISDSLGQVVTHFQSMTKSLDTLQSHLAKLSALQSQGLFKVVAMPPRQHPRRLRPLRAA